MAKRSKKTQTGGRAVFAPDSVATPMTLGSTDDWVWGSILLLAVFLAYVPVCWAGYLWDDDTLITANPCIVGPLGLKDIWTTSAADVCPLTITTFWVEHALWGAAALPYHLVNVLLHAGCAVVLWRVLLGLRVPGAWLGAALWALHPVQVESVAWITEMKNTESGLFFLLAVLFFLRWLETTDPDERSGMDLNYGLTVLFAAMAMASKSSTVVLPVVLGLCAWWMDGRWHGRTLAKIVPLFLLSAAASALSIWTQAQQLANDSQWSRTLPERLAAAGDAVWFYLGKLVWPYPLMAVYPRWTISAGDGFSYLPLLAVIAFMVILWLKRESWGRPWFFMFAYFLVALLPVLGLFDDYIFRHSLVFDHFQYLASMGPLALAGAGLFRLADAALLHGQWLRSGVGAGLLLALGWVSFERACVFANERTLWTDTLIKNPACWVGYNNLGEFLYHQRHVDDSIVLFQKALEINPNYVEAQYNLGNAFLQKRRMDDAIVLYEKALAANPRFGKALNNLGNAYVLKGQMDDAMAQFQKALQIDPNFAEARNNFAAALLKEGRLDDAIIEFQEVLKINLNNPDAHNNLGYALLKKGRIADAITQFQECLRLKPDNVVAQNNLAKAQAMADEKTEHP